MRCFCLVLILSADPSAHSSNLLRESRIEFNKPSTMNDTKYSARVYGVSEECIAICHSMRLNETSCLQTVLPGNRVCNEMHEISCPRLRLCMLCYCVKYALPNFRIKEGKRLAYIRAWVSNYINCFAWGVIANLRWFKKSTIEVIASTSTSHCRTWITMLVYLINGSGGLWCKGCGGKVNIRFPYLYFTFW